MVTLATKPVTKKDFVKRIIALRLDHHFLSLPGNKHKLIHAKDFDELVGGIANDLLRFQQEEPYILAPERNSGTKEA
jgi:hypothetical protein